MDIFYKRMFLLFALLCWLRAANAQTAADFETMYTRLFASWYAPSGGYDPNNVKADGTFRTVAYPTVQPTNNTGEPRPHLNEMLSIARTYHTPGPNYKSQALLDAYCRAWNWWLSNNPSDSNSWWRSIGWPNTLYPSFVLMGRDLQNLRPADYTSLVNFLMAEWTPKKVLDFQTEPDGANTSDVCKYTLATAIVTRNAPVITDASNILGSLLKIEKAERTNGIQPDFSYGQHVANGRQLNKSSYGKEFMGGLITFINLTHGTFFEVSPERMNIFENLLLEGASWMAYRNMFDHHQQGRTLCVDGYPRTVALLNSLIQLNTPQKARLQQTYDWMSRSAGADATNLQQGNRMFWRHDYMVHKGLNYFATTRMTSTRTTCSESGNNEGVNQYYTGSGVNYIYLTGQEYYEIWPDMNWRRLPGTTAPQKPVTEALPLVQWGKNGNNIDPYAGGVSDGKTGVSGFLFRKNDTEINLQGAKSWFYFQDYFVALGAGIQAGKDYGVPYATTINQMKYKGSLLVDEEGSERSLENGQSLMPKTSEWAYINNIGYQFLTNTQLHFEVKTAGTTPLAWLSFNHGNLPANGKYAYAVYPNVSQQQFKDKRSKAPFQVVSNTTSIQSVADTSKNIVQAIFYTVARLTLPENLGTVETSHPALIQLRWTTDSLYVSAANPFCETRPLSNLTVKISGLFSGQGALEDESRNQTTLQLQMPANEFQGQTLTVGLLKNKRVTGIDFNPGITQDLEIYPNPVVAGRTVSILNTAGHRKPVTVSFYDMNGTLSKQYEFKPDAQNRINLETRGLKPGVYVIKYDNRTGKIIVE
ncbi:MAG: polysaccharide lyase family 8 super-sandwich domain-containing protein [Adhaeribacter sp.]